MMEKSFLNIQSVNSEQIVTEVINGGRISNKKGVNIPEVFVKVSSLTKKELKIWNYVSTSVLIM